jgi:hypothetical protein
MKQPFGARLDGSYLRFMRWIAGSRKSELVLFAGWLSAIGDISDLIAAGLLAAVRIGGTITRVSQQRRR